MARKKRMPLRYAPLNLPPDAPFAAGIPQADTLTMTDCLSLVLVTQGEAELLLESGACPLHTGDVACVGCFVPHALRTAADGQALVLHLVPEDLARMEPLCSLPCRTELLDRLRSVCTVLTTQADPLPAQLTGAVFHELTDATDHSQATAALLSAALLLCLDRRLKDAPGLPWRPLPITPALRCMHAEFARDWSMDELAEACHMSPTHFRRCFQAWMGRSPLHHLHSLRIRESMALLKTTGMSIGDIAKKAGYATLSSFNRQFAAIAGLSPTQYRRADQQP